MQQHQNPWTSMWLDPRGTIRSIVDTDPHYRVLLLAILGGFSQTLSNAAGMSLGDKVPIPSLFLLILLSGPVNGLLSLYVGGFVLHWVSAKLGGQSTREEIRAAIAWSWVPLVSTLPLWIVKYILFRDELFLSKKTLIESQPLASTLYSVIGFIDVAIAIWSLLLLYNAIGEVNRFSSWRGIAAVLLAGIIITLPVMIIISTCMAPMAGG